MNCTGNQECALIFQKNPELTCLVDGMTNILSHWCVIPALMIILDCK